MDYNTSDYFSYKKNKLQAKTKEKEPLSKLNFLFQLFIATFVIIFLVIVVVIMKYSSKMDIEYSQGDLYPPADNAILPSHVAIEEAQGKIDKRLTIIQREENAPSEAKIITKEKNAPKEEIIDPIHIENIKKIDKIEKIKAQNELSENNSKIKETLKEIKNHSKTSPEEPVIDVQKNVTITSKVLIGRYINFEEAQAAQELIKQREPNSTAFVRKTGDVFSVQMGSYQDFSTAKAQAQILKAKGFDVWIYQQ